ncbi:MAG: ferredoxin family 2Fe-2S iron-sulfur cluster binding protein [Acetobacteraceae bacterium]
MPALEVIDAAGRTHSLRGAPGDSVMQLARAAGLPVLGDCNGSLACATCHVIVDPAWAARLPPPNDEEEAMLDTVFDLKPTSRLGCQILLGPALDGIRVTLP